jgi:hypothetical protein
MKALRLLAAATFAALSFSAHAVGHLADITILDRATGQELPVHWHQGRAYVVGKPGNEYQVVMRNQRGEDLLAVVSVDGVNVLSGETASSRQGGYVLSPWTRMDIAGWRKSLSETAAFYFTSLGDSYAARTDRPDNVGVIGVALYQRRPLPVAKAVIPVAPRESFAQRGESGAAADSNSAKREAAAGVLTSPATSAPAPSAPLGTGHGRREESQAQYVQFERATRDPVETIAIYYDSYRNLAARGIVQVASAPRDPQPFPARFAPDPWR